MKKTPERKCLATNKMYPKDALLRVVKNKEGLVYYDPTDKAPGRGAYILRSVEAVKLAQKKKVFDKAFQVAVDSSIYETLLKEVMKERK